MTPSRSGPDASEKADDAAIRRDWNIPAETQRPSRLAAAACFIAYHSITTAIPAQSAARRLPRATANSARG